MAFKEMTDRDVIERLSDDVVKLKDVIMWLLRASDITFSTDNNHGIRVFKAHSDTYGEVEGAGNGYSSDRLNAVLQLYEEAQ